VPASSGPRRQALARAEYAERAKIFSRPTAPPPLVIGLLLALFITTTLLVYGDIGPPALLDRLGLIAVIFLGLLVVGHLVARVRARRLGLSCPSCGHYPLGIRRVRYGLTAQVAQILACGRCDWCGRSLFRTAA
jgi:hypothetical protein